MLTDVQTKVATSKQQFNETDNDDDECGIVNKFEVNLSWC